MHLTAAAAATDPAGTPRRSSPRSAPARKRAVERVAGAKRIDHLDVERRLMSGPRRDPPPDTPLEPSVTLRQAVQPFPTCREPGGRIVAFRGAAQALRPKKLRGYRASAAGRSRRLLVRVEHDGHLRSPGPHRRGVANFGRNGYDQSRSPAVTAVRRPVEAWPPDFLSLSVADVSRRIVDQDQRDRGARRRPSMRHHVQSISRAARSRNAFGDVIVVRRADRRSQRCPPSRAMATAGIGGAAAAGR